MVAAFIDSVFVRKDVQQSLQTAANLLLYVPVGNIYDFSGKTVDALCSVVYSGLLGGRAVYGVVRRRIYGPLLQFPCV